MVRAGADLTHALAHQPPHEHGRRLRALLSQPELPRPARAPRVHVASVDEREDVRRAARDLAHALRRDLGQARRHRDERDQLLVEVRLVGRRDGELRLQVLLLHIETDALLSVDRAASATDRGARAGDARRGAAVITRLQQRLVVLRQPLDVVPQLNQLALRLLELGV